VNSGSQKRKEALGKSFHHSVYVILLDPAVLQHPSILRLNPNRDPAKSCVYDASRVLTVKIERGALPAVAPGENPLLGEPDLGLRPSPTRSN